MATPDQPSDLRLVLRDLLDNSSDPGNSLTGLSVQPLESGALGFVLEGARSSGIAFYYLDKESTAAISPPNVVAAQGEGRWIGIAAGGGGGSITQLAGVNGIGITNPFGPIVTVDGALLLPLDGSRSMTGTLDMDSNLISNVATPISGADAANKTYVDNLVQGFQRVIEARVASTANIVSLSGLGPIDGVALSPGDIVFVKNQSTASENGSYVAAAGAWSRDPNYAAGDNAAETFFYVDEGTTNAATGWVNTNDPNTAEIGTDPLTFAQFSSAGYTEAGNGLSKTGNTLSVLAADGSINVAPGGVSVLPGVPVAVGTANAQGAGPTVAYSDHTHQVTGLVESSGPTALTIGAIADGQVLTRSGATIIGTAAGGGGGAATVADKNQVPLDTSGDQSTTGITITSTPNTTAYVEVLLNGVQVSVQTSSGVPDPANFDCYFSADGGTTAKTMGGGGTIAAGDTLYWNNTSSGFDLEAATDLIDFNYDV